MGRILLTGASGFIASHVLDILLQEGHSVVGTVRSKEKCDAIKEQHPGADLDFVIVEDIAEEGAFDKAVISDPPFDAIIHTASPFHFHVTNVKKELLDPAIQGTTGVLKAAKKSAPSVKKIVITSSFASIVNRFKGSWPEKTYTEEDWNPITYEQALQDPSWGYTGSKTLAEKAAWDFVKEETPGFELATINPPLVFGPLSKGNASNSLNSLNTSNERVLKFINGDLTDGEIPTTGVYLWVDVRDVALAHVRAIAPEASGRYFVTNGHFSNKKIVEIIKKDFPDLEKKLPTKEADGADFPAGGIYKADNSKSIKELGLKYHSLETTIVDLVKSLQELGA